MDNFRHYQKMRNDNHNYADSLYVLYVFLRKSGLNIDGKFEEIEAIALYISGNMRAVNDSLNQLEQYSNGNPNKYSKQYLIDGLGVQIRNMKYILNRLERFEYKKEFVHMDDLQKNYQELLDAMEYWERTIKND